MTAFSERALWIKSLIDACAGLSKRLIEELVRTMFPKTEAPAAVRRLPVEAEIAEQLPADRVKALQESLAALERPKVAPQGRERFMIQFCVDRPVRDRLGKLQALLRHRVPDGDLEQIFVMALDLLLEDTERKRFAKTERPRRAPEPAPDPSRRVPAAIRRVVHERDEGRCTYMSPEGRRCESRQFLEFHPPRAFSWHHLTECPLLGT